MPGFNVGYHMQVHNPPPPSRARVLVGGWAVCSLQSTKSTLRGSTTRFLPFRQHHTWVPPRPGQSTGQHRQKNASLSAIHRRLHFLREVKQQIYSYVFPMVVKTGDPRWEVEVVPLARSHTLTRTASIQNVAHLHHRIVICFLLSILMELPLGKNDHQLLIVFKFVASIT
jgi:hypothetical protein